MLSNRPAPDARRRDARGHGDAGSALMLMPAAVMIVLLLGAIAVDLGVVHLAQRDVVALADSAANDAVTAGLDEATLRRDGTYRIDADQALTAVQRSVTAHHPAGPVTIVAVTVGPADDQVTVELEEGVERIFAKALPGASTRTTVRGTATATAARR